MTSTEESGMIGIDETESDTLNESESGDGDETQLEESNDLSIDFEEESLASSSLIMDSAQHLHGLMKSVAKVPEEDQEDSRALDPNRVNAACNCAKQIHNLMKLQLAVLKEVRTIGNE